MDRDLTPVLIGVGQVTEKEDDVSKASSQVDLMEKATRNAVADAGIDPKRLADLDILVVVKCFREATRNSPNALARRISAQGAEQWLTPDGGNTPQYLVNRYAEEIAQGKKRFALFAGSEAMATARKIIKSGNKLDWDEPADEDAKLLFPDLNMSTEYEQAHGIWRASWVYPLFENALRGHYGTSIEEHQLVMGELISKFTQVAAKTPGAWFPIERTAEEVARVGPKNRFVGWPYTKYMNAMNQINQSAALLLTSVGFAKELGVDESKWVYLHGCADAIEIVHVQDRVNYYSSPAIRTMGREAHKMAGRSIDEIDFIDLYSCFPSAVQIARDELGISKDDPRALTITGGLPAHGGAGNNYVMNAIASMVDKVRAHPGKLGLVTANGGYLTKHAAGIYSTSPSPTPKSGDAPWQRVPPAEYQKEINALPRPDIVENPEGDAHIETYTVTFGRSNEPEMGIVVGRIGAADDPQAPRFIANTVKDPGLLDAMTKEDFLGRTGTVRKDGKVNIFSPAS